MSPRKPFFYGWWIAIAAALGLGLGGPPILVFSFPVFLKALIKEFHASRSAIALAFSLHNVVSAFASPFAGRLLDRVGVRRIIPMGISLFAAWLISNRFITSTLFGLYIFNIGGALLGMACGPIPYSTLISKWFDRRRGSALAIMMSGLGISAIVMPSIIQRVITAVGWRASYSLYGVAMLLIPLPILAALLRETPAEMGLLPDGESSASFVDIRRDEGLAWRETRRTSTFWIMTSAVVLLGASVHACLLHLAAMLTDEGMAAQTAALASSIAGSGILTGRLITGVLLDRYFGPRVAMYVSGGAALGIVLLLVTHGGTVAFVAAFLVGLGIGAEGDLIAYLTSRYFGLKAFGLTYGIAFGSFVLAGAAGALLMGVGFDRTNSYATPLLGFFAATLAAIVLFSRLGPYRYVAPISELVVGQQRATAAVS